IRPIDDQSSFSQLAERTPQNLVSTAVQLLACVVLFFGARGLASFWRRVRGRGVESSSSSSDSGGVYLAAAPDAAPFAGPALKWPAFRPAPWRHGPCSSLPPLLSLVAARAVPLSRWQVRAPRG